MPPPPPPEPPCDCDCECGGSSGNGGGGTTPKCPDDASEGPVRYFNGEVQLVQEDLTSEGFGLPWGHVRTYSNQFAFDFDYGNGFNWAVRQWAVLGEDDNGDLFVLRGARNVRRFAAGTLAPLYGSRDTLAYDSGAEEYTFITSSGEKYVFYGFDRPQPRGLLKTFTTAGGQTIAFNYTGALLTSATWPQSGSVTQGFQYTYLSTPDPNAGRLSKIVLYHQPSGMPQTVIRQVSYTYYDGSNALGNLGDLHFAITQDANGLLQSGFYYRYYTGSPGYPHALKFVVGPESLGRILNSATPDPDSLSDAALAPYADYYFQSYDSNRRVTSETTHGGGMGYNFAYTASGTGGQNYNVWQTKTVETRPLGGGTRTVYTNFLGQVMLSQLSDGTKNWVDYYQYDSEGRLILHASPAAVQSFNDAQPNLAVALKSAGLVRLFAYYATDTSPAAKGYLQYESARDGTTTATERKLRQYEYGTRTAGGVTVRPVTKETTYTVGDGSDVGIATNYTYQNSGTVQMQQRTTTLPAVPIAQNGTNTTAERWERFDALGNLTFARDERGYITGYSYDPATQALTQQIQDTNQNLPSGWSALPGSHLNLTTDYTNDSLGRATEELGPAHDINGATVRAATWTVYKDLVTTSDSFAREVWTTQGYLSGSTRSVANPVAPVTINRFDGSGNLVWTIVSKRDPSRTTAQLTATESYSDQTRWVSWTANVYPDPFQLDSTRVYFSIPASGTGGAGNYDETFYHYEDYAGVNVMGRQDGATSPGGTITRSVIDARGLTTGVWVGTDATGYTPQNPAGSGANNLRLARTMVYDSGVGGLNGNLTQLRLHVDSNSAHDRVTNYQYDFRNRETSASGPLSNIYFGKSYDNLDRIFVETQTDPSQSFQYVSILYADYDTRGRVYRRRRYVTPSAYPSGNVLYDYFWYDDAGNQLQAKPAGSQAWTKQVYDALGRAVKHYTGYGASAPNSVANDLVFEQVETTYDQASNVILQTTRRRFDNAPTSGAGSTGDLQNTAAQPNARVSYVGNYFDAIGRPTDAVNWGNNGNSALTRPTTAPARSDTVLITTTIWDDAGRAYQTRDPAGILTMLGFDAAGRVIQQWDNEVSGGTDYDQNRYTVFTFTPDGQLRTVAVDNGVTGAQVTQYIFGTTLNDSEIASSQLLRGVIYPDSDNTYDPLTHTFSGTYNRIEHRRNRQGETTQIKDQNQTVHDLSYDALGRQTVDAVTLAGGSTIDNGVLRVERAYTRLSQVDTVTSYDGNNNVVNQVKLQYNELGQLTRDDQEHAGAVTGGTLKTQYGYADGSANTTRRTSVTYPNTRVLNQIYNSGVDDNLSRVSQLNDGATTQVAYAYLGLGTVMRADLQPPKIFYTLWRTSRYDVLDNFDRLAYFTWYDYNGGTFPERVDYAYDRVSNRLSRERQFLGTTGNDEKYTYDKLSRLTLLKRGTLSGGSITSPNFTQNWEKRTAAGKTALDPSGNWTNFRQDNSDGGTTWSLDQERTHDKANTLTAFTTNTGTAWATPAHDLAGNMTSVPQPGALASGYGCVYDAWNRLVKVTSGGSTVATYAYDGLNRRIKKIVGAATRHYYYSDAWQVLEERVPSGGNLRLERQFIWGLRYVDDLVRRDRDTNGDGMLNETRFVLQDANFNVTVVTNATGTLLERYRYDAYGVPTALNPTTFAPTGSPPADDWETLFAGYRWDSETGFYHVRHRQYHPPLGRWMQRDPVTSRKDFNLFEYCISRPISQVDALGLASGPCCGTEVGALLLAGLRRITAKFIAAKLATKFNVCESIESENGWDINEFYTAGGGGSGEYLFQRGSCGAGQCIGSVTIYGHCYWAAEANYVLWGWARQMCHSFYLSESRGIKSYTHYVVLSDFVQVPVAVDYYDIHSRPSIEVLTLNNTLGLVSAWRSFWYWSRDIWDSSNPERRSPGSGIPGRLAWTRAGWMNNLNGAIPANIDAKCPPCKSRYTGSLTLHLGRTGRRTPGIGYGGDETIAEAVHSAEL